MNRSVKIWVMIALILAVQQPASAALAEDVTGTWQVTIYAPGGREETGMAVFKQTGNQVTGWVGPNEQNQNPISDAVVKEDKFTATVNGRNAGAQTLDLTVRGEEMTGTITRADGRQATVKFKRTK
jgi:hypothetical protein